MAALGPTSAIEFEILRWRIQFAYLFQLSCAAPLYTIILPESYDLGLDLGTDRDGVVSGWIIGSAFGLSLPVLFMNYFYIRPRGQVFTRMSVILGSLAQLVCPFVVMLGANPPDSFGWSGVTRQWVIFLGRSLQGFGDVTVLMDMEYVCMELSTPVQIEALISWRWVIGAFGNGLGPVISSVTNSVFSIVDVRSRAAVPMLVLVPGLILSCVNVYFTCPHDLQILKDMKPPPPRSDIPVVDAESMSRGARKWVWFSACLVIAVRSLVIPMLEAASVLFLQTEFHWSTGEAGYAVGVSFVVGLPMIMVVRMLKKLGFPFFALTTLDACLAFLFCLFLFPSVDNIFLPKEKEWILILMADSMLFAFETVALMHFGVNTPNSERIPELRKK